jgi:hypothetical protein
MTSGEAISWVASRTGDAVGSITDSVDTGTVSTVTREFIFSDDVGVLSVGVSGVFGFIKEKREY